MSVFTSFLSHPYIFGGAALSAQGGGYGFGQAEAGLLDYVFDRGIRVFDTAPIYGFGASEQALGLFIKNKREKVSIISKSGVDWHDSRRVNMSNDPKTTQKMLLASLTRMKTEYIDHYMIHWPDTDVDIRFPLEVLAKNQLEGKIKSIGLCNTNYDDLEKALEVVEINSVQMQNNLFERPSDRVISFLEEKRIPFVGWGVFDKGIISARVDKKRELSKNYEEGDSRKKSVWWKQADVLNKIEKIEKLKPMLRFHELSLIEAAINYAFAPKWADHILIGSKTIKDWEQVLDVSRREIASEILLEMEAICHS